MMYSRYIYIYIYIYINRKISIDNTTVGSLRLTPITSRACTRGAFTRSKVIGKITKTRDLHVNTLVNCKHNKFVEFGKKTGFSMLRIKWHGLQASRIVYFVGHHSHAHRLCLLLLMHTCTACHVLCAHATELVLCVGIGRQ